LNQVDAHGGINLLFAAFGVQPPMNTDEERAAAAAVADFNTTGRGYFVEQATRPQTIGYALLDSPVALAAWMLDHDTDSYYKISRAFLGGPQALRQGLAKDAAPRLTASSPATGRGTTPARRRRGHGEADDNLARLESLGGLLVQEPGLLAVRVHDHVDATKPPIASSKIRSTSSMSRRSARTVNAAPPAATISSTVASATSRWLT
jgi:hypothetical protein